MSDNILKNRVTLFLTVPHADSSRALMCTSTVLGGTPLWILCNQPSLKVDAVPAVVLSAGGEVYSCLCHVLRSFVRCNQQMFICFVSMPPRGEIKSNPNLTYSSCLLDNNILSSTISKFTLSVVAGCHYCVPYATSTHSTTVEFGSLGACV